MSVPTSADFNRYLLPVPGLVLLLFLSIIDTLSAIFQYSTHLTFFRVCTSTTIPPYSSSVVSGKDNAQHASQREQYSGSPCIQGKL